MALPIPNLTLLERVTHPVDAFALYHYLSSHGLPVRLWERPLRSALGDIPFLEAATELYLEDASRLVEAQELIQRYRDGKDGVRGAVWTCRGCGESHDPEFGACWKCGRERP
ncbi:MAG TPA: DUF2007 domain-containing protein [bacterium]